MANHRCSGGTGRATHLQQLTVLLDMPYRWLEDSHGYTKLLAIQEEVEALEEQFRQENRCITCGNRQ